MPVQVRPPAPRRRERYIVRGGVFYYLKTAYYTCSAAAAHSLKPLLLNIIIAFVYDIVNINQKCLMNIICCGEGISYFIIKVFTFLSKIALIFWQGKLKKSVDFF